ncbi:hypothetical protein ACFL0V_04260 [Nanoarchaeota archaeon]
MNLRMKKRDRPYVAEPEEIRDIAKRFSIKLQKELGPLVKSVVLFGSFTRHKFTSGKKPLLSEEILFSSDIDILILFDDLIHVVNPEVITAYRVITEKCASQVSKRLHITTLPLTKFWDYCQKGDPILINMLRDGEAVYDTGTFGMAKKMLHTNVLTPTREIIWIYLANGPLSLQTAKWNLRQAAMDLYWSVMDAAHSALLRKDVIPDSPEHLVPMFDKFIISNRLMDKKYLRVLGEFHNIGKQLMRGELKNLSGQKYEDYKQDAKEFLHAVKEMLKNK